ncbi:DNA alkylation repair protein [Flavobacterium sp. '19STA2R22 D10 B1']|uniref:DNA alkylation repair protein n=1 Tax=Flavobacterium aerium TaxID=3037261 RepID=UPI00278BE134|nr:DNA alkylation repair protein [Flavobacterium sp. '19STA2R22 D10 B1']
MGFCSDLKLAFQQNASEANAIPMANYMKNRFAFYGIKSEQRKALLKAIWKEHSKEINENPWGIALALFQNKERECHYCAVEIISKTLKNKYQKKDIGNIEILITHNSWWDTVDATAKDILGNYLMLYPEEVSTVIERFSNHTNMWLNRSAILFQLGYKEHTNPALLFSECMKHASSNEFFIQKAIGWALREYAKKNSKAVLDFVDSTPLKPLSKREALKHFK